MVKYIIGAQEYFKVNGYFYEDSPQVGFVNSDDIDYCTTTVMIMLKSLLERLKLYMKKVLLKKGCEDIG